MEKASGPGRQHAGFAFPSFVSASEPWRSAPTSEDRKGRERAVFLSYVGDPHPLWIPPRRFSCFLRSAHKPRCVLVLAAVSPSLADVPTAAAALRCFSQASPAHLSSQTANRRPQCGLRSATRFPLLCFRLGVLLVNMVPTGRAEVLSGVPECRKWPRASRREPVCDVSVAQAGVLVLLA